MNKELFNDLYYGDYRPNDIIVESNEYNNLISDIIKQQNILFSVLPKSKHNTLKKLITSYTHLSDLYGKQSYSDGIKFATNFLFNALCNNDSEK